MSSEETAVTTFIRAMHPYGFRSGRWAILRAVVPGPDRDCYLVEFDDHVTDFWPVDDPSDPYEFRTAPEPSAQPES